MPGLAEDSAAAGRVQQFPEFVGGHGEQRWGAAVEAVEGTLGEVCVERVALGGAHDGHAGDRELVLVQATSRDTRVVAVSADADGVALEKQRSVDEVDQVSGGVFVEGEASRAVREGGGRA